MREKPRDSELMGLTLPQWQKIAECILQCPAVEDILIYGSRAKGTFRQFSDIDITLKGKELRHTDLFAVYNRIDDLNLPYEIDLSIKEEIDYPPLVEEIENHSVSLLTLLS